MRGSLRGAVLALAAWSGAACGGAAVKAPVQRASPARGAVSEALAWVADDVLRAERAGAGSATALARGAGAAGDSLGGRFALPAESCGLFLAGGSPSLEDIDVFVYGDDGAVLAADESTARTGWALVCPPRVGTVYAFARVAAGHGLVSLSAQVVPAAKVAALRATFQPSASAGSSGFGADPEGWPGLAEALLSHRAELGGTWREVRRVAVPVDARVPAHLSVSVEARHCIDAFVVPVDEVAFVELTALDAAGRITGRATTDTRNPSVVLCAAERTDVTLELRPHAGRGPVAVVLSDGEARPATEPRGAIRLGPGAALPLAAERARLGERLARRSYGGPRLLGEGAARVGTRQRLAVDLPAGCTRVDAIGGAPLRQLSIWLSGATGELEGHDGAESGATVFACGRGERVNVDVEALAAGGPFALEGRPLPAPLVFSQHPLAASRLLAELEGTARFDRPADAIAPKTLVASPSSLPAETIVLAAGECATAAVALGPGAEGVLLRALSASGSAELARSAGAYSARLDLCAVELNAERTVRVELSTSAGSATALFASRAWRPRAP